MRSMRALERLSQSCNLGQMPGTGFVNETSTTAIELVVLKPSTSLNFHF